MRYKVNGSTEMADTSLVRVCDVHSIDQGQKKYEEQQRQRSIAALRRRIADLGFIITPSGVAA